MLLAIRNKIKLFLGLILRFCHPSAHSTGAQGRLLLKTGFALNFDFAFLNPARQRRVGVNGQLPSTKNGAYSEVLFWCWVKKTCNMQGLEDNGGNGT